MKIYNEENEIELKNVSFKNYGEDVSRLKAKLENIDIDFKSIHLLRGNKELLQKAFQEVKAE